MSWEIVSRGEVAALSGLNEERLKDQWYDWVVDIFKKVSPYEYPETTATITAELHDGNGTDTLHVKYPPIVSVTTVLISNSAVSSSSIKAYDNYVRLAQSDDNVTNPVFTMGTKNISITYVAGFSTIPGDIKLSIANAIEIVALHTIRGASIADLRFDNPRESDGSPAPGVPYASLSRTVRNILKASGRKRIKFK